jgi:hypothetical protein
MTDSTSSGDRKRGAVVVRNRASWSPAEYVEVAKPETHIRALLNLGDELLRRASAEKKR